MTVTIGLVATAEAAPGPWRVYLFTAPVPPGLEAFDDGGRQESLPDLRRLASGAGWILATGPGTADAQLGIVLRRRDPTDDNQCVLWCDLAAGSTRARFEGRGLSCYHAAAAAVSKIERWRKDQAAPRVAADGRTARKGAWVKIYFFTAPTDASGLAAPDLKARTDSLRDLQLLLYRATDLTFQGVINADEADVVIEVLGREQTLADDDLRTVRVKATAGPHSRVFEGRHDDGSWTAAASDASKQIRQWIALNYAVLITPRKTP